MTCEFSRYKIKYVFTYTKTIGQIDNQLWFIAVEILGALSTECQLCGVG